MKFFFNGGSYPEMVSTLKTMGHEVLDHNAVWLHYLDCKDGGKKYSEVLKKEIIRTKPDVYFATKALKPKFKIDLEIAKWINKNVGMSVYWSQDDPFFVPAFMSNHLYAGFRIALTCAKESFPSYTKVGLKPYLFWPAFDSSARQYTYVKEEDKVDFVFVGTPYVCTKMARKDAVFGLIREGIKNIELYGNHLWVADKTIARNGKPFISGSSLLSQYYKGETLWTTVHEHYCRSRINMSNHVIKADMYLNDRVPIIMGVAGFLMLDKNPGLEKVFENEKDVVFFDDCNDFVKKAKYYMARPEERLRIGVNGRVKTLKSHTYQNRARQLLNVLSENGFK